MSHRNLASTLRVSRPFASALLSGKEPLPHDRLIQIIALFGLDREEETRFLLLWHTQQKRRLLAKAA